MNNFVLNLIDLGNFVCMHTVPIKETVVAKVLELRSFLMPYMYTSLYKFSTTGEVLAKPMSFE